MENSNQNNGEFYDIYVKKILSIFDKDD